jgi:serine/threonine-protein kinase
MGVVVAARHVQLDAPVALKFMTEQSLTNYDLVNRFLREARATARLRGEHVVRVSDVGTLDSGAPYMVMEYLQGLDLAALLAKLGPPPIANAVEYVIQACEGLAEAHRAGLVHRDVKPSNLFLTQRPNGTASIKVLDFGISKAIGLAGEVPLATSTHAIFGSPLYMAPEQMRAARDVDARADIWSIGASLYELLSGGVPFAAQTLLDLAYRIANEDPPSLRAKRPEIARGLESIVLCCLQKNRDRRFPDAFALAEALSEFRSRLSSRDDKTPLEGKPGSRIVERLDAIILDPTSSDELETRIMPTPGLGALPAQRVVVVNENPRSLTDEQTLRSQGVESRSTNSALELAPIATVAEPLQSVPFGPDQSHALPALDRTDLKASALSWGQSQRLSRKRRRPLFYGVLLASGVTASSVFILRSRSHEDPPAASQGARSSAPVAPESSAQAELPAPGPKPTIAAPIVAVTDLPRTPPAPTATLPTATKTAPPSRPRIPELADAGRKPVSIGTAPASPAVAPVAPAKVDPLAP